MLDTSSLSVVFVTDSVCSSKSPIISLSIQNSANSLQKITESSENETETESVEDVIIILTKDAHIILMSSTTGNLIGSQSVQPNENSSARSMNRLGKHNLVEVSKENLILLCCEDALYFYSLDDVSHVFFDI